MVWSRHDRQSTVLKYVISLPTFFESLHAHTLHIDTYYTKSYSIINLQGDS